MTIAPILNAGAPYIAAALELAKWSLDFAQRAQAGALSEGQMKEEWEANVRFDVGHANALWLKSKAVRGQDQ